LAAGLRVDLSNHYVAIVEDAGPETAVGIWFPDLPGCFSAGDSVDEALGNAPEAIALYAEALDRDGRPLPPPRSLTELKRDPAFTDEVRGHLVALVSIPRAVEPAE
jgi:predicted RNase H-like HicB family nuclease